MRKFLGAFALGITAFFASPAAAQDLVPPEEGVPYHWVTSEERVEGEPVFTRGPWYVGGEFGAMIVEDTNVDIGAVEDALRLSHEYGYDGGLFVGYDLGGFRIEAEAAYKKADLDSYTTSIRLPGEGINFPTGRPFAGGSTSVLSFMVNGMLDFGEDEKDGDISGFVGGGVGMARVKANNQRVFANTAPFLDDSDSKLAWQVFAGVRQRINDNIDVTVKYRFFNVADVRMTAFNGNEAELRFRSHSLLGGITFNFGKRTKPVTPRDTSGCKQGGVMDSLDSKCPDKKRCYPGGPEVELSFVCNPCPDGTPKPCTTTMPLPFMVFFDWDKSELTPEAMRILDQAVSTLQEHKQVKVIIDGHADRSGGDEHNRKLSEARAKAVKDYLTGVGGLPKDQIRDVRAHGENKRLVETEDGVRHPQNRRVEISYGPNAGW